MAFFKRATHRERRKDKGSEEGSHLGKTLTLGTHLDPPAPLDRPLQPGPLHCNCCGSVSIIDGHADV